MNDQLLIELSKLNLLLILGRIQVEPIFNGLKSRGWRRTPQNRRRLLRGSQGKNMDHLKFLNDFPSGKNQRSLPRSSSCPWINVFLSGQNQRGQPRVDEHLRRRAHRLSARNGQETTGDQRADARRRWDDRSEVWITEGFLVVHDKRKTFFRFEKYGRHLLAVCNAFQTKRLEYLESKQMAKLLAAEDDDQFANSPRPGTSGSGGRRSSFSGGKEQSDVKMKRTMDTMEKRFPGVIYL